VYTQLNPKTPSDLIAEGFTTEHKANLASRAVGQLYRLQGEVRGILAAEVRLTWFWALSVSGEVREHPFSEFRNAPRLGVVQAVSYFHRQYDSRGEFPVEEWVYSAEYGELLAMLRLGRAA
jgi:hypothetical protein